MMDLSAILKKPLIVTFCLDISFFQAAYFGAMTCLHWLLEKGVDAMATDSKD